MGDGKRAVERVLAAAGMMTTSLGCWLARPGEVGEVPFRLGEGAPGSALVTGASSGIGEIFARRLAAAGYDLLLVARREERLAALVDELTAQYDVSATIIAADLAAEEGVERVVEAIRAHEESLDLLINNAGFGTTGHFDTVDLEKILMMIRLHIIASACLCHAALPQMIVRRQGAIINHSSLAAYLAWGGGANYSGTKAYLKALTLALHQELRGTGVRVQALCPGLTYSEFHDTEEYARFRRSELPAFLWMSSEEVVEHSLRALMNDEVICVPGRHNQLLAAAAQSGLNEVMVRVWRWLRRA